MTPVAGGRHCASCDRVVRDLTRATEVEARGLAALFGGGRFCARLRLDGDEAVFREEGRRSPSVRGSVALAAIGLGAAGCSGAPARPASPASSLVVAAPDAPAHVAAASPPPATPAADRDGDGVPDDVDRCPDEVGDPAAEGCVRRLIVTTAGDVQILESVRFQAGSAALEKEGSRILDAVAEVLRAHPEIHRVEVHGNTDGVERSNGDLALARAKSVVEYLVRKGISRDALVPLGDGSQRPIAPSTTPAGRAANRRIDFRVVADEDTSS